MEALVVVIEGAIILRTRDCHMLAIYGPQGLVKIPSGRKFGCHLFPGIAGMGTLQDFDTIFCKSGLSCLSYNDRDAVVRYPEAKQQTPVLLSSGPETKCDSKSASRVDGLLVPCVIILNYGPHPLQDLSEHGWVHPDKIPE